MTNKPTKEWEKKFDTWFNTGFPYNLGHPDSVHWKKEIKSFIHQTINQEVKGALERVESKLIKKFQHFLGRYGIYASKEAIKKELEEKKCVRFVRLNYTRMWLNTLTKFLEDFCVLNVRKKNEQRNMVMPFVIKDRKINN